MSLGAGLSLLKAVACIFAAVSCAMENVRDSEGMTDVGFVIALQSGGLLRRDSVTSSTARPPASARSRGSDPPALRGAGVFSTLGLDTDPDMSRLKT